MALQIEVSLSTHLWSLQVGTWEVSLPKLVNQVTAVRTLSVKL